MYNKLLGIMREQGRTQAETAEAIGISLATLNQKLKGHSGFTAENIKRLCGYLDIPKENIADVFFNS